MREFVSAACVSRLDESNGKSMEIIYYTTQDGKKFACSEREYNSTFNPDGQHWHACESIPANAEWIGNYHRPSPQFEH